jgi:hypothetical protein
VTFAHGKTAEKLRERFGAHGLLVWVCYLAACKRNWVQGRLTYTSEPEGWTKLGLHREDFGFTLAEFFQVTGQLKQTKVTRVAQVTDIVCTRWGDWNKEAKREIDAERNRSKRTQNTVDDTATIERQSSDERATENYNEKERGLKPLSPSKVEGGNNGHAPSSGAPPPPSRGSLGRVPSEVREVRPKLTPSQRAEAWVRNTGWDDPHIRHHLANEIEGLDMEELERLIALGAELASERA